MTTTTDYPVTVDGFPLDNLAWNIELDTRLRGTGALRLADASVPGMDGVLPYLSPDREPLRLSLACWVRGTDADGMVPGGREAQALVQQNLDDLLGVLSVRHRLLDLRYVVDENGAQRQALARCVDPLLPEVTPGSVATFTATLEVPSARLYDPVVRTVGPTVVTPSSVVALPAFDGSTVELDDLTYLLQGPSNNPRITDPVTGAYVQLNRVLTASERWRLNTATWSSRVGASLGLGSLDTTGTDVAGITQSGGPTSRYLTLTPVRSVAGVRSVSVVYTDTGGATSATALSVRGLRAFVG